MKWTLYFTLFLMSIHKLNSYRRSTIPSCDIHVEGENMQLLCGSFSPVHHLACYAAYSVPVGLEYVTEIQVIGQSPRYHCELCDSKFDHNLKFPHLVGSKHRFNVLVSNEDL